MAQSASIGQDAGGLQCYTFDVVVIGAGIIGLSTARQFLLQSDLSVAVVDASVPLRSGATGAGQGYIWMTHRTPDTPIWDLAMRSRQLWQMLIDNLQAEGIDPLDALGWKRSGSLLIGRTKEESCLLKERVQKLHAAGLRAEYLSSNDLLVEEPELEVSPETCAAFLPDDGQIDVHNTVSFLEKGNKLFTSQSRYKDFYDDPAVCLLRSSIDRKVEAVQTNTSIVYAKRAIVVAAGCWSGSLVSKFATELGSLVNVPVQPRKGFLLTLEKCNSFKLNHGVMEAGYTNYYHKTSTETNLPGSSEAHLDRSLSISMTATLDAAGNLLVGSSRQFVGFNTDVDKHIIDQIWERNREFFPALRKFSIQDLTQNSKVKVGLRPYMPDGKPVIGPIPSMPNVFLATGHEGAGLTLALGTAEMIADMVLGNPLKVDPKPFSVQGRCC
ncbi:uncharacterized protein LOC141652968 [Silene latifolia]|uniref:uncharacterized protein LOC141652968 n=1 Tax=Silene latifolia TaxID=37657 RepID=UPI003D775CCE